MSKLRAALLAAVLSIASIGVALPFGAAPAAAAGGIPDDIAELVSKSDSGTVGNGETIGGFFDRVSPPVVSENGNFVVFASRASNFVANDPDGALGQRTLDVFIRDRAAGTTRRITTTAGGDPATADPQNARAGFDPSISADGTLVEFNTFANTNLDADPAMNECDPDSPNGTWVNFNGFVKNLATDEIIGFAPYKFVTSPMAPFPQCDGGASQSVISPDGKKVVFASNFDWIANQPTVREHVYVYTIASDSYERVDVGAADSGPADCGGSNHPYPNFDASKIAFLSCVTGNTADPIPASPDGFARPAFVRDMATNTTTLVSRTAGGAVRTAFSVTLSGNGQKAVFASLEPLVAQDSDQFYDVYSRDLDSGDVELVSVPGDSGFPRAGGNPSPSHNGRFIAFNGDELTPLSGNTRSIIYRRDTATNKTRKISRPGQNQSIQVDGNYASISSTGSTIAYLSHTDGVNQMWAWDEIDFDLDVDTDRDGTVEVDEDNGEGRAADARGAIVMTNLDDDDENLRPDTITIDVNGNPGREDSNIEVSDPTRVFNDVDEITEIVLRHPPPAVLKKRGLRLFLTTPGADKVGFHLFKEIQSGALAVWGGLDEEKRSLPLDGMLDPSGETTVGIEALFFANRTSNAYGGTFPNGFDGVLDFALEVRSRTSVKPVRVDKVALRVAPLLLLPHTQRAQELWLQESGEATDPFLDSLRAAVPDPAEVRAYDFEVDQWAQDHAEIGYTHAPGRQRMHVTLRLPRGGSYAGWPAEKLLSRSKGLFALGGRLGRGPGDFGGNIELLPPSDRNPLGRVVIGNKTVGPSPFSRIARFFEDQGAQPTIEVDTQWLNVGHVDEMLGFLDEGGFDRIVAASPDTAVCLLGGTAREPGLDLDGLPCDIEPGIPVPPEHAVFFAQDGSSDPDVTVETADGTATGVAPQDNVLLDATQDFTTEDWRFVRIYAGTGKGQVASIDPTSLTLGSIEVSNVWRTGSQIVADPSKGNCISNECLTPDGAPEQATWFVKPDATSKYVLVEDSKLWRLGLPALTTVSEIRRDNQLWRLNRRARTRVDTAVIDLQIASNELGLIEVPTIYMGELTTPGGNIVPDSAGAFTPGAANFQPFNSSVAFFPQQHGPRVGGVDVFEQLIETRIPAAVFIEDWDTYHAYDGEVHCGTNVVREPFGFDWWDPAP